MPSKRRSLDDALTPEQAAFLQGTPAPSEQSQQTSPPEPSTESTGIEQATPESITPRLPKQATPNPDAGLMSLNTRIDPAINRALLRVSMERKINRITPFTQQDIVAEALRDWLKSNGYWGNLWS